MTDATSGPGAEGAPRDGKPRGRSAVPAAAPGRDPVTGEKVPGNVRATGAETGRGRETESGGGFGGETATGRDAPAPAGTPGAPAPAGTPAGHGPSGTSSDSAPLVTGSEQSHGSEQGQGSHGGRLLPRDESDKLSSRLQHAVTGFVDAPKSAVEEADHVLEEAAARFTDAVTQRRRTLRNSWQATDGGGTEGKPATSTDTEQLRLALRDYRELAERLLRT
ncbi:hypothetical protein OG252_34980 [Streptomyces sp. NBC_01352]|uniref:hypothetical protein n=1 Tax=unclassified Streptomyces TaxID=2593676 RepID=UPI00225548F8|nr:MULTISPECIES: hypothetical protein [unclassified Streptomyces]MCX4701135.1 hypothetical protein [Streptomyces sp. NBC_01373]